MSNQKELHGWVAFPRDAAVLLKDSSNREPAPLTVDDIPLPDSPLAKEVMAYAKGELNEQTFNHSMRVFYYGEPLCLQILSPTTLHLTAAMEL